jgi:hypothetical protein
MKKILISLVAVAAIGAAAIGTSSAAQAQGWGPGWGPGPFIAGALIGGAVVAAATAPHYYGGYGPYYATPYGYNYGPGCQRVWNGYYWVRACY